MGHLRGKHVLRAGTEVGVQTANSGTVSHVLKRDLDVSDAAQWCSDETGVCYNCGILVVDRGERRILFNAINMVDVTGCSCGGKGVFYEPTDWGKGGRGKCCLNCEFGKK